MKRWGNILKKSKYNRVCCLVLSIMLVFMGPANVFAKDYDAGFIIDENVEILTQEAFDDLFGRTSFSTKADISVDVLKYKYDVDIREDNLNVADVRMWIMLEVAEKQYSFSVSGEVDKNGLQDGGILWFGSLVGTIKIQKNECLSTVVFAQMDSDIQLSMTIQPLDANIQNDVVILSFGKPVLTNEMLGERQNEAEIPYANTQVSTYARANNQFKETLKMDDGIGYDSPFENLVTYTSGFSDGHMNLFGNGQKMIGSFDKNTNRLAVSLKSYCSSVNAYYNNVYKNRGSCVTRINEMSIRLKRGNGTKYSYIANTESFDFGIEDYGTYNYIMPLIADAITLLDVAFPTALITQIFQDIRGTVHRSVPGDMAEVKVKFGIFDYSNFDDCETGFPIIFQLHKNNSSYTGTHEYIMSTSICYRTLIYLYDRDLPIVVDTWALDNEWAVNIELN